MTTILVTYPGDAGTRFDRAYYVARHLPLVMEGWRPFGLESATAFFPAGAGGGTVAICVCEFRDDAAVAASFASPEAERIMADIVNFTDVTPRRLSAQPV